MKFVPSIHRSSLALRHAASWAVLTLGLAGLASAQQVQLVASLDGSQEVPPVATAGTGSGTLTLDLATSVLTVSGSYSGLTSNANVAHLHGPAAVGANAGIIFGLTISGGTSGTFSGSGNLTATQVQSVLTGLTYLNVHTANFGNGELRGQVCRVAQATLRNSGSNPASYTSNAPVLGATFTGVVDLSTTGHSLALLFGFSSPVNVVLGGGQTLLCLDLIGAGEFLAQPFMAGPLAQFDIPVPTDLALCGFPVCTQALHFGAVSPFALSNAQDLIVGM